LSSSRSLPVPAHPLPWPDAPLVAQQYLPPGTSRTQFITMFRAHWRQTVFIALALIVLLAAVLKLMPKTYTATATLMVNYDVNQGGKETPIGAIGSYMATQVELMQSDEVLLPAIDRLRLTQDSEFTAGFDGGDDAALRIWVLRNLRASLTVTQGRGSQLLYLEAAASDSREAALIANTIVDVYLVEEHRLVNDPASRRAQEYSAQLTELQEKVGAAQEKVTHFRQRSGISDITAHNDVELQSLNALEQLLLAAQNARRTAEAKGIGDQAVSTNVLSSQMVQTLKGQLAAQKAQLAQLSATLGAQHPRLLELRSQIAATQGALRQEIRVYSNNNSTEVVADRQLEEKLQGAVESQRSKLLGVRGLQDEGARLLLELDSAQAVYKRALDGYDQIMFDSGGKLTNVTLMSNATPAVAPARPNKLKLMLLGVPLAIVFGLAAPLAYELWFNRRVRCRDDLERDFGMAVLAEFEPRLPREGGV
jgi:succinoglycan biosynthesis transport protein ExoP